MSETEVPTEATEAPTAEATPAPAPAPAPAEPEDTRTRSEKITQARQAKWDAYFPEGSIFDVERDFTLPEGKVYKSPLGNKGSKGSVITRIDPATGTPMQVDGKDLQYPVGAGLLAILVKDGKIREDKRPKPERKPRGKKKTEAAAENEVDPTQEAPAPVETPAPEPTPAPEAEAPVAPDPQPEPVEAPIPDPVVEAPAPAPVAEAAPAAEDPMKALKDLLPGS